jgi:BNR repeat-like domain
MTAAFLAGVTLLAAAQSAPIDVGEDRGIVVSGLDAPVVEPHLSINPKDPTNLIAAAMVGQSDNSYGVIGLSSHDGGRTWQSHDFGVNEGGDVWTAFLPDGTAVLSLLAGADSELQVFRSSDGGRTWSSKPSTVVRGQDHPTLLVHPDGSLYTVSTGSGRDNSGNRRDAVVVAQSTDGGAMFAEPVRVVASNLSYEAHNPALLSDGMLLIPFADHRRPGSRRRLEAPRDWLVVSSDRGHTFSEPMLVSESCDGRGGWSSLAVLRDRIYHLCSARELNGIQLRYSDNRGETWSEPIRIDHPDDTTPQTRTPAIAVNREGVVAIAWYDARGDRNTIKGNFRCQEIFFTASVDGGVTFLPEVKVSTKPSCPATPRNVETALRFPAGGEYMGMAAAPDGSFRLLWADNRSEIYRLYTATVSVRSGGATR